MMSEEIKQTIVLGKTFNSEEESSPNAAKVAKTINSSSASI